MKVGITPDAHFELIFDPTVGDIMSGRGRGDIAMMITPSGEFTMRGDVELTQGEYLFTLRNLVNKKFTVDPGGHITWYGDPFDAQLNINAVYKLRAPLYDIMPVGERTEAYRKRVPVEVLMQLSDKLMNPQIDFQVRLPSVDEGTRTQVASILGDKDKLNRQVFGLIVVNKFIPEDVGSSPGFAVDARTGGATTLSEFGSSQLSNALSKLTDQVDIGVNYRPGSAIAADEWEVALGTAVFNDRVQLSTNVGVATGTAAARQGNQFLGDFSAEYLITRDGKLRFKAFSQSNDRNLNQLTRRSPPKGPALPTVRSSTPSESSSPRSAICSAKRGTSDRWSRYCRTCTVSFTLHMGFLGGSIHPLRSAGSLIATRCWQNTCDALFPSCAPNAHFSLETSPRQHL